MKIQILVDNPNSWMVSYASSIIANLVSKKINAILILKIEEIQKGDILFLLSCEKILKKQYLELNKHNLVIHASDLPSGKGWSPLTWQIIEGRDKIPLTMIEAAAKVDSGVIYEKVWINLDGSELIDELRSKMASCMEEMIIHFINNYPRNHGTPQLGDGSFYPRREPKDSELDIHKNIFEQFNLLRVADNERYPVFFVHKGHKYNLKIEKVSNEKGN